MGKPAYTISRVVYCAPMLNSLKAASESRSTYSHIQLFLEQCTFKGISEGQKIFMVKNNHIRRLRVAGNWIQNMPLVSYTASCIIWMTAKQVLPFSCIILQTASTEEQIVALCLHKSILLLFLLVHLIHNCQSSTIWSSITCVCDDVMPFRI